MYVELVRGLIGSRTFVTPVGVAVTTNRSKRSTAAPVADVFCVARSSDHIPVAYEPATVPSNIQPTDAAVAVGARVIAFDAVPGIYGHSANVVPFAIDVPVVAAAPGVSDIWATAALAETTVDAVDVRYSV